MPKFIMREARVAGPLTFKQAIFFGGALVAVFILYFTLGKKNMGLFILIALALVGGAAFFAFAQIQGRTVTTFIQDFMLFTASSKVYFWKKAGTPPKILKTPKNKKEKDKESPLRIAGKSQLKELSTQIETRTK